MWVAQDGGTADGYIVRGPDGHSRGLGCYGGINALEAGGNERGISMGVRSGGRNEGDGKEGGRGRVGLVDRVSRTPI